MPQLSDLFIAMGVSAEALFAALAVYGVAATFFGYRLFKLYLFVIGFILTFAAVDMFTTEGNALIAGLLGGLVSIGLWYVGLFLTGAALGAMLCMLFGITFPPFVFAVAIVFGILAIIIRKFVIILSTSWSGAGALVSAAAVYVDMDMAAEGVATVAVAIAGVAFQYAVSAKGVGGPGAAAPAAPSDAAAPETQADKEENGGL